MGEAFVIALRRLGLITLPLLLVAAAGVDDWLRTGNEAYARGDYPAALEAYGRAVPHTDDPGQVAYNLAAAHYQLGQFGLAEQGYQHCLEDAEGLRRVQACYGLGNALARQGQELRGKPAVRRLQRALQVYSECMALAEQSAAEPSEDLYLAAQHNYQQVEALLRKKQAEPDAPDPGHDPDEKPQPMNDSSGQPDKTSGPPDTDPQGPNSPGRQPQTTSETRPGKGNLPPLLDDAGAPPLDPSTARDHLSAQMDRIRQDRSQRRMNASLPTGAVRDW